MNNGIYPQDFSFQYSKVDQVIRMVSHYGPGALTAKFDVESAYCFCFVLFFYFAIALLGAVKLTIFRSDYR